MIFWREVQYLIQPFSSQHREQHISKWNYAISVVQETHIFTLELKRWSLELNISFSKVYIWDLSLAHSFWDHIIQISIIDRWIFNISQPWKVKSFVERIAPNNQIPIFEEQLRMSNLDFYILYWQAVLRDPWHFGVDPDPDPQIHASD